MSSPASTAELSTLLETAHDHTPGPEEAQALLSDCSREFCARLFEATRASLDLATDLFESATGIPDGEIESFKSKRSEWIERFERAFNESLTQWQAGHSRSRPASRPRRLSGEPLGDDPDRSGKAGGAGRGHGVPAPFHAARAGCAQRARRSARSVAVAGARARQPVRPRTTCWTHLALRRRSVYPLPRIWRSLMVRVLADLTPTINKVYISQNRMLADRGVLPDMKAALRARSEFRPTDDKELLPTFSRMLSEVGALPTDIVIPVLTDASVPGVPDTWRQAHCHRLQPPSARIRARRPPSTTRRRRRSSPRLRRWRSWPKARRQLRLRPQARPRQETSPTSTR